jgi:hypothetical protein
MGLREPSVRMYSARRTSVRGLPGTGPGDEQDRALGRCNCVPLRRTEPVDDRCERGHGCSKTESAPGDSHQRAIISRWCAL